MVSNCKSGMPYVGFTYINVSIQSGPQDQKSVTFSHSVISLNQLLQNSKNIANIFLKIYSLVGNIKKICWSISCNTFEIVWLLIW